MLTLITYPEGFDQPSVSPFCVKVEYLLNASGQAWKKEVTNDPRKAPRGKLPVLRTPDGLVHDSGHIQAWLEAKGAQFDAHLGAHERAHAHSIRRMAEEHLYFLLVLDRWERPEVWPTIRDTYFKDIPKPLRGIITAGIRRGALKGLQSQGLGRLTWPERLTRADADLSTLRTQLGDRAFLFGHAPTSIDASVAAILGALRSTPVDTPLSQRMTQDASLSPYIDRVHAYWGSTSDAVAA